MAERIDPKWAWQRYVPDAQHPWNVVRVGHLYRRAAFGASKSELDTGIEAGPDATITRLLTGNNGFDDFEEQTQPLAASIARANDPAQARAWWLHRMLFSPHPLRERLTLFWHDHFATSYAKVRDVGKMLAQFRLMHRHALDSFDTLLIKISTDPAMLVWLDTIDSTRRMPNENYARELMELFSLGIGHYTETDIREAARAFTGWELRNGSAHFNPSRHDDSEKTIFGKTGRWAWRDVVEMCLEKPVCARFIARKLFVFLVSETIEPTDALIEPLAASFRESGYHTGKLVETILRSNLFFSSMVHRSSIKSPVDFTLGIVNGLEGRIGTTGLAQATEPLGQILLEPPSVAGWDAGPAWLNAQTFLFRNNLALALVSGEDPRFGTRCDPARLVDQHKARSDTDIVDLFLEVFLQGDIAPQGRQRLLDYMAEAREQAYPVFWSDDERQAHRVRSVCHLVLTMPEFQLL